MEPKWAWLNYQGLNNFYQKMKKPWAVLYDPHTDTPLLIRAAYHKKTTTRRTFCWFYFHGNRFMFWSPWGDGQVYIIF